MIERRELYIDGAWRAPQGQGTIEVIDAHTEDVMGTVPAGDAADAVAALESSARALDGWSRTRRAERVAAVRALADGLEARNTALSEMMAREVGTPITTSERVQVGLAVTVLRSMAAAAEEQDPVEVLGTSVLIRVPVGVVGAITPWNYPLYQLVAKLAPAMLQGCTTVLKPSSVAPLAAFDLLEIAHEAGIPAGVINLVTGAGAEVGEVLASHPLVDMVSLTGSTSAGARVAALAAPGIKRLGLELGGKSATVVAPGADLEQAVANSVRGCFINNGQTCSALTRLVVTRDALAEVEERRGRGGHGRRRPAGAHHRGRPHLLRRPVPQRAGAAGHRRPRRHRPHRRRGPPRRLRPRLLRQADRRLPPGPRRHARPGGSVRPGAQHHRRRRPGPRRAHRQRQRVRPVRCRLGRGPAVRRRHRRPPAHRTGGAERRTVQRAGPVRRVQEVRRRPRARAPRAGRVRRAGGHAAARRCRPGRGRRRTEALA
ncbi:MAG: aldehyde dehydrogenase family protein [Ilumatobacteraceae bacterium]